MKRRSRELRLEQASRIESSQDLGGRCRASAVFGDSLALLMPDPDHSLEEERYLLLGMSNRQRLLVVAF